MLIVGDPEELRREVDGARSRGGLIGVVPTMGALHAGHMSLLAAARFRADRVIASVFVNPLQFGPGEDFERYPRDLERDVRLVAQRGATLVFAPDVEEMYPEPLLAPFTYLPAQVGNALQRLHQEKQYSADG